MFGSLGAIIFFSIALFLRILLIPSRRGRISRTINYNDYFEDSNIYNSSYLSSNHENPMVSRTRTYTRRRKALKACKPYLKKINNTLILTNKYVILKLETKQKILTCIDKKDYNKRTTVVWKEQQDYDRRDIDNIFEETFDVLCMSFNESAKYSKIQSVLTDFFSNAKITTKETEVEPEQLPKKTKTNTLDIVNEKININTATEKELNNLAGINIIQAKKAIKYREENDGFKSVEEFYDKLGIKLKFRDKLNEILCAEQKATTKKKAEEHFRIIDF